MREDQSLQTDQVHASVRSVSCDLDWRSSSCLLATMAVLICRLNSPFPSVRRLLSSCEHTALYFSAHSHPSFVSSSLWTEEVLLDTKASILYPLHRHHQQLNQAPANAMDMESSKVPFLRAEASYSSYELDFDEQIASPLASDHPPRSVLQRYLAAVLRIVMVVLAIWGVVSLYFQMYNMLKPAKPTSDVYRPGTLDPELNLCDCGTSVSEAMSRSCVYDTMSAAWLPPYCRDAELTAEFDHAGPGPNGEWAYFADANGTKSLTVAEMGALGDGERSFWAPRDWHIAHCLFYWEKYIRMRNTGLVMERRFDRVAHARHCRRLVMRRNANHDLLLEVWVKMNASFEKAWAAKPFSPVFGLFVVFSWINSILFPHSIYMLSFRYHQLLRCKYVGPRLLMRQQVEQAWTGPRLWVMVSPSKNLPASFPMKRTWPAEVHPRICHSMSWLLCQYTRCQGISAQPS